MERSKKMEGLMEPLSNASSREKFRIKKIHDSFVIFENLVGILYIICVSCGWESKGFRELTADECPKCGIRFKKNDSKAS